MLVREHDRKWFCAVMVTTLLIGLTGVFDENSVMAKNALDAEVVNTVSGNQTLIDTDNEEETVAKADKDTNVVTVSGNETPSDAAAEEFAGELRMPALTDEQENINITFPSHLEVAFNPLGLAVGTGGGSYSTAQIISGNYEIINTGSADGIVTVTIFVEDLNGDQIVFVDSPEAVEAAGKDAYAIYLSIVSAEDEMTGIDSDGKIAVSVHEGENQVSFRLPADGGMAAFTFDGVMNGEADWWELSQGIKISTVYSCETVKEVDAAVGETDASAMAR